MNTSQKTSLFEEHKKLNAKIVDFAGWEMPIQYANLKSEVQAVRDNVGMFDVSHMGEFIVEGLQATQFVDYLLPNDYLNSPVGKALYSPLCREDGTIIDDLIVYKLSEIKTLICVNAANIEKDFAWIQKFSTDFDCTLTNKSEDYSLIALQGPNSFKVLNTLIQELEDIDYYSIQEKKYNEESALIARTGYTGEDGFEIFSSHKTIQLLWAKLIEAGVAPCGLGSRDVLRLEVCYPLYGNELNDNVTPLETGLKWTVKMNKDKFIGKSALEKLDVRTRLIKLSLEKGIPRAGYTVENSAGEKIGEVTSGTMSVSLSKGIAIARVQKDLYSEDAGFVINIRNKKYPATLHKKAFFNGGHK